MKKKHEYTKRELEFKESWIDKIVQKFNRTDNEFRVVLSKMFDSKHDQTYNESKEGI